MAKKYNWLPFDQAASHARLISNQQSINTEYKWVRFRPKPLGLPTWPNLIYKNIGWISWSHWLGTNNIRGTLRRHIVNDDFFKHWSCNMAYVLGFWFADGCICKRKGSGNFLIAQQTKDKYILEKILNVMGADYPVMTASTRVNGSQFEISSESIYNDIVSLGGMPKKSLKVRFPNVPDLFVPDFIRGVFDGDGSISVNPVNHHFSCYICGGSHEFLSEMQRRLKMLFEIESRLCYYQTCFRLSFGARDVVKFGTMIYKTKQKDMLALDRKRVKFEDLIAYREDQQLYQREICNDE